MQNLFKKISLKRYPDETDEQYTKSRVELTSCGGMSFAALVVKESGLCELLVTELNCPLKKHWCVTMDDGCRGYCCSSICY